MFLLPWVERHFWHMEKILCVCFTFMGKETFLAYEKILLFGFLFFPLLSLAQFGNNCDTTGNQCGAIHKSNVKKKRSRDTTWEEILLTTSDISMKGTQPQCRCCLFSAKHPKHLPMPRMHNECLACRSAWLAVDDICSLRRVSLASTAAWK